MSPVAGGLRITWLGHATVLVELDGVRVLTDPVLGRRVGPLKRIAPPVDGELASGIDAVLLSHLHADHADPRSLRRLGPGPRVLVPRGAAAWLRARGVPDVEEIGQGDEVEVGPLRVTAVPAAHDARRRPFGGPRAQPLGFVVGGARTCYFAGDTDLFAAMGELAGSIDAALLPVWGWGPSVGPGHLDPERAAEAAARIAAPVAIPIHWGTLALPRPLRPRRDSRWPARAFAAGVARRAPEVEVRVLAPGERTELA